MSAPRILVFACNWCSYMGADLAGISRREYPTTALLLRVPCSGRVDPGTILKAFASGADGVLVTGCHPGDCHYRVGNDHAHERVEMARTLVEQLGIGKDRLQIAWISSSEGGRFADLVTEFAKTVAAAGPLWTPKAVEVRA